MAAQPAVQADVLLQWIYTQAGGVQETVSLGNFYPDLDPAIGTTACTRLKDSMLITVSWGSAVLARAFRPQPVGDHFRWRIEKPGRKVRPFFPVDDPLFPDIRLTASGISKAERSHHRWTDRTLRNRAARDRLLAWLYGQTESDQKYISLSNFSMSPDSIIEGHFLSRTDIDAAFRYLSERSLIKVTENSGTSWRGSLMITSNGIDCVERGGNVAEYLEPREDSAKYIINGPISGTSVVVGDNATQNTTINGTDSEALRALMDAIVHVASSLRMHALDQQETEAVAGQIIAETRQQTPDRRKLHDGLRKLRDLLAKAGNQAFAAAIDYELAKLGLPRPG